jgi:hypothetical protein
LGAFVQGTYDHSAQAIFLDNTDVRYARTTKVGGMDVLWGITANNNPTVQDVWNTTPAWSFPYLTSSSNFVTSPVAGTLIEGTFAGRVAGAGAYVWINNMVYAEISAYGSFDPRTLTTLGNDPTDGSPRFSGVAPYWRVAVEKTWDANSLMVGTFGMSVPKLQPTGAGATPSSVSFSQTDFYTDIGIDAQYQYVSDLHAFTVRASYIWERAKLNAEFNNQAADNLVNKQTSFKISASYIYDRSISLTGGYFDQRGTTDATFFGTLNGSPNTNGWIADIAYLPFSNGGPEFWPWLNARIGVSYTHYDKFDGATSNYDGNGRNAKDNDVTFVYTWFAF